MTIQSTPKTIGNFMGSNLSNNSHQNVVTGFSSLKLPNSNMISNNNNNNNNNSTKMPVPPVFLTSTLQNQEVIHPQPIIPTVPPNTTHQPPQQSQSSLRLTNRTQLISKETVPTTVETNNLRPSESYGNNYPTTSPNVQLYQKLLHLVSADFSSSQLSSQMSTLLSNPNIRARLKQLHVQLLQDPNQYWPKLESILLHSADEAASNKGSQSKATINQSTISQDLLDLRKFYAGENEKNNQVYNSNAFDTSNNAFMNDFSNLYKANQANSQGKPQNLQQHQNHQQAQFQNQQTPTARIIAREFKR